MEWVNITAKTLPEAIDLALDNLGVDEAEAEIEVLEEPRQGLFGRMRGNARVRARVKPKATRPKVDRGRNRKRRSESGGERSSGGGGKRQRSRNKSDSGGRGRNQNDGGQRSGRRSGGDTADDPTTDVRSAADGGNDDDRSNDAKPPQSSGGGGDSGGDGKGGRKRSRGRGGRKSQNGGGNGPVEEASMDEVSEQLETFLSGLTEAFGFESGVTVNEDDGGLLASVEGRHGLMVGPKGRTLDAIQELARVTAQRSAPSNIRIKVDVGGYRALRREALIKFALEAAEDARDDGKERSLEPMNSADRKVVHDALSDVADIETRSAGTDPRRRVVVVPLGDGADDDGADDADERNEHASTDAATSVDGTSSSDAPEGDAPEGDESGDASDGDADDTSAGHDGDAVTDDEDPDDPTEVDESESVGSQ